MKQSILATLLLSATTTTFAQQAKVVAQFEGLNADSVCISLINDTFTKEERLDKVPVTNGKFEYTADIKETRTLLIYPQPKEGQRINGFVNIFLLPSAEVSLTGTMESYKVAGKGFYDEWQQIRDQRIPYVQRINACNQEFRDGQAAGLNKDSLRAAITPRFEAVRKELSAFASDYIRQHPKQDAAVTLFDDVESDLEETFAAVSPEVRQGVMSGFLDRVEKGIQDEKARLTAADNIVSGKPAPDFTLDGINGTPLTLSSFRGKYVVLDFWGSWCVWCIRGVPKMKEYYAKYAGKFEILGIDCNDTQEKWKEAVTKHQLPWLHVYNPRSSSLLANYAVTGFPTKILVDPQGNIVKVFVGEDPEFYNALDKLFDKQ